ncbi:MAG: hypothetical protein JKY14_12555 [Paraglaciecola sp.]|nr:hypothetical protein [Paraglaciecola sp.]
MIARSSYLLVFILTFSACILAMDTANAWGFDMFSFFTKKDQATSTVVHASLDAKLTKLTSYPANSYLVKPRLKTV